MSKVQLIWEPINKSQGGFVSSTSPRCLFSGAWGAGKTIALCAKALKLSIDYPGNFGLLCRKVRATLPQTTIKTWFEKVCPQELIAGYNKSEGLLKLTNGSSILFGGLDDPLKLGSLELGWAGIDEAIETTEDDWRMLEGRLRFPGVPHQLFAATNPGPPSHYLHRIFFTETRGEAYQAQSFDNPALPEDYKQRLAELEGVYRDRYVLGLWKGLEGLIYSMFDEKICLIPRFEINQSWPIHCGHDFGLANPAALFFAESPGTGDFYAWAEYFPGGNLSIYDHVQAFKTITQDRPVIHRVGGSHQEGEIRQGYMSQGWPISEPKHSNDKNFQIKLVQGMHRRNKVFIFNDLRNYLREKFSFVYKAGTDLIEHEERFHLMACERYLLSDFTPETAIRNEPITKRTLRF